MAATATESLQGSAPVAFTCDLVNVLSGSDPERLAAELNALLSSERGRDRVPELWALSELSDDSAGRHKDNFAHSIRVVSQTLPDAPFRVRVAALFHDVGKAATRRIEAGKVTFHNHELVGARLTRARLATLGFTEEFAAQVVTIVDGSARIQAYLDSWTDSATRRLLTDTGELFDDAVTLARADVTSRHAFVHRRVQATVDAAVAHADRVRAADARAAERPVLSGEDLAALGVERGPQMGVLLRWLLEQNREGNLTDPAEAAAAVLEHPVLSE